MTTTRELARFIDELRYTDLPDPVVEKVKEITLNSWGVQLASSTLPWSKLIYRYGRSQGGVPECTVVNYGMRTSAANAAFINGCFGHGFEMDDNNGQSAIKGGCMTVPSALAFGEKQLNTGKEFITAVAASHEIMTRISLAAFPGMFKRGHHPTGTCGAFGAATVASKLLGMDGAEIAHALAIAGAHMVGYSTIADGGAHLKRTLPAMAAAGGIRAALLADAGLVGPETMLEVGYGFCRSFEIDEARARTVASDLGSEWKFLESTHIKIYAQDGFIQPMTEALDRIRKTHSFKTEEIESVWLGACKFAVEEVIGPIREPKNLTDAQFSANFSVALFLTKGGAGFHEYSEDSLHDAEILDLSRRVVLEVDDEIEAEYQKRRPRGAKVAVRLKSGEVITEHVADLRTMTVEDLDDKFRQNSTVVLDRERSERLLSTLHHLEDVRDISNLAPMLVRNA